MKKALTTFVAIASMSFAIACASDMQEPQEQGPYDEGSRGGGRAMSRGPGGGAGLMSAMLMLPADWWHDSYVAGAVGVTPDQAKELDRVTAGQSEEIAKLNNDIALAQRKFRDVMDGEKPTSDSIVAAGTHVRDLGNALFDRQVKLIAAERQVLSTTQWTALQQQMSEHRGGGRQNRGGGQRGGGHGGHGGGRGGWGG